jgi:TPR repeat protein
MKINTKLSVLLWLLTVGCAAAPESGASRALLADDFWLGQNAYEHKNYINAYRWLRPAAEAGNPNAQFYLAMMYDFGHVLTRDRQPRVWARPLSPHNRKILRLESDRQQAQIWYRLAAEQGHDDAQFYLAMIYGKQQNHGQAVYWLSKAAAGGDEEALAKLENYARQQDAEAQYALACIYRDGVRLRHDLRLYPSEADNREIAPDPEASRRWLQKAAANGHAPARRELLQILQK